MVIFTANEIESFVKRINLLKKDYTSFEITEMEEFYEFRMSNRMFFELILSDNDVQKNVIFKQMMKMKRNLEGGEEQYSVDVKFGQYMADKFIDPVINKKK